MKTFSKGDVVECPGCGEEDEWDGESCIQCVKCYLNSCGCGDCNACNEMRFAIKDWKSGELH